MVCNDRVRALFLHSTYLPQADCTSTYAQSWGCPLTWGHDQTVIFISIDPVWAKNYFWCKSCHFLVTFWPKRTETTQNVYKLTTILCCCLFLMLKLLDFWNAQKAHFEVYFDTTLPNFCLLLSLLPASFAFLFFLLYFFSFAGHSLGFVSVGKVSVKTLRIMKLFERKYGWLSNGTKFSLEYSCLL